MDELSKRVKDIALKNFNTRKKSFNSSLMQMLKPCNIPKPSDENLIDLSAEVWAYTCATYVANSIQNCDLKLFAINNGAKIRAPNRDVKNKNFRNPKTKQVEEVKEILQHPILSLIQKPNERQTKFEFISETQMWIDTTGDCFWFLELNAIGLPESIEIIPASRVKILVNEDGTIKGYQYQKQNSTQSIIFNPEQIVHFRTANTMDPYRGMGCLEAAYKSGILLESMANLEISINENSAIPALIVAYKGGSLPREDRIRLQNEWESGLRGISKSGKIKVTDEDFDVKPLSLSPREMNFLSGRKWSREEICAAYRVPISLVTSESVNRANAEAGLVQFSKFGLQPRIELIEQTLNKFLVPKYDEDRIFVEFENVVPEDREFELKKLQVIQSLNLLTSEEILQRLEKI